MWNTEKIAETVTNNKVVIFAKGTKLQPMCGFSNKAIELMNRTGKPFEVINIFEDENIRPALISYSNWPTTPQVFVGGELLGGSDIVEQMFENGDLAKKIEAAFAG
jgi:monothiol glutaredoxin